MTTLLVHAQPIHSEPCAATARPRHTAQALQHSVPHITVADDYLRLWT